MQPLYSLTLALGLVLISTAAPALEPKGEKCYPTGR